MFGYTEVEIPKAGRGGKIEIIKVNANNVLYHRVWCLSPEKQKQESGKKTVLYMAGMEKGIITDLHPDQLSEVLQGRPLLEVYSLPNLKT